MLEFNGSFIEFSALLQQKSAVLAYFSTEECQVCKVLKPKVIEMITEHFEQLSPVYVPINTNPEIAGQCRIFAVPTIVIFFEGKEFIRKSRGFSLEELKNDLLRPYRLLFS
ncbi:thioredoxin family protein [Mangrovibacterium sp.]|uniref:thioredoxin family protein n=1 Tax=Mangrovibacterium sp. TaxID=1961364 RepID=UPI0035632F51